MANFKRLSMSTAAAILLLAASAAFCAEDQTAEKRLEEEIVGTWESDVVKTEWGPLQFEMMFGANGVLVVTMKDAHWGGSASHGEAYRIVGDQLIRKDPATATVHIEGNTLKFGEKGKGGLTRKSRTESVGTFLSNWIRDMKSSDQSTRCAALEAIRYVGPEARGAIPVLRERLKDREVENRQLALDALVSIGPDEKEVLPLVLKTLNDKSDPILVGSAADGLGEFGPKAKEAVPALIEVVKTGAETSMATNPYKAAEALGQIGPDARAAIPVLTQWATGRSQAERRMVAEAIKKIEAPPAEKPKPKD